MQQTHQAKNWNTFSLQADAAASLLADALTPVEWAVFRHVAGLMRAALEPDNAAANGLTAAALSALLSDLWFGQTPHSYRGKGDSCMLSLLPVAYILCVLAVIWRASCPDSICELLVSRPEPKAAAHGRPLHHCHMMEIARFLI